MANPLSTTDFLATVPLFASLDADELAKFGELLLEQSYARGGVILVKGDPGDSLFIVRKGRVKVVLVADDGREVILGILGAGEYFGELSLLDEQPRSADVIAMDHAVLLVLRRDDFRRRVEANASVAWSLLSELSRRLRRADGQIGALVLLDVPARIARLLLDTADAGDGVVIEKLTHQTIARVIGASRETVSRALGEFIDAGWLASEKRRIQIVDREALLARSRQRI